MPLKAHANIGIAAGYGDGVQDIRPYRVAISWDFGPWLCKQCTWSLAPIWETSSAFWHGSHGPNGGNDKLYVFSTGPMLRWQRIKPVFKVMPYLEAGIGASWLSHREIGGRQLSLHFQFQDSVGIGFRFGKNYAFDLTYRLMHYSNASLKRPNSGVNLQMLNFGVWFR